MNKQKAGIRLLPLILVLVLASCGNSRSANESSSSSSGSAKTGAMTELAVFVPGVVEGSPTYEALVAGVEAAADERDAVEVRVVEGGFNQDQWAEGVTSLAATGRYECIITSNPALPEICKEVATRFPNQRFVVLDGFLEGNDAIYTLLYNQMEQSYLIGHLAGLITTSSGTLSGANTALRIGLIAGQEYPIMNRVIRVGYEFGAKSVNPEIELDFRVVGNWYDAAKGGSLASIMYDSGADVILAIAGSANQGVIAEAERRGTYVLWYDSNGYSEAPGRILGSSALEQKKAAYEKTLEIIDGTIEYGTADIKGVADGYVTFIEDDPLYIEHVPEEIRALQHEAVQSILDGKLQLEMPTF